MARSSALFGCPLPFSAMTVQSEAKAGTAADVDSASEAAAVGMGYWSEDDLPFYYGLARTFPLADRWFSSCLGPTFPNRRFLIAGTAHGLIDDSPYDLLDYPPAGTIFDMLTSHGISGHRVVVGPGDPVAGEHDGPATISHVRRSG